MGFNSENNRGGLFLCWTKRVVFSVLLVDKNIVCCKTKDMTGNEYFLAFVYCSPTTHIEQQFGTMSLASKIAMQEDGSS